MITTTPRDHSVKSVSCHKSYALKKRFQELVTPSLQAKIGYKFWILFVMFQHFTFRKLYLLVFQYFNIFVCSLVKSKIKLLEQGR